MKRKVSALTVMLVAIPLLAWGVPKFGFKADLTGNNMAPPVKTEARGGALFDLSPDGHSIHFTLSVQNATDVTGAHIHLATGGKDGPPVVTLYPFGPACQLREGKFSGNLAEGMIIASNLEGPLKGKPLKALLDEILSGNAYIKIHTKQHPEGELRGQITRRPA